MNKAENHLILIDGTRTMTERSRQLTAASNDAVAVEYEDFNDRLGQTLECVVAFDFGDGSRLERAAEASSWDDGVWHVAA